MAEAKRTFSASASWSLHNGVQDVAAMDVADGVPAQAAGTYGHMLRTVHKEAAKRPEVHALLERTWSVIAYHLRCVAM